QRINDAFVVDHVATISPTFILNFRASIARYVEGSKGTADIGFDQTTLGFPASLISQLPGTPSFGRYEFADYTSIGRYSSYNYTNTVSTHPGITWLRGSKTWRAGVDMRWTQYNEHNEGNPFRLTASRGYTQQSWRFGN
ncbi:MAG: hypothetical protein J2P31_05600, partial [Blastocatellia bacterium]|nr:hypothetical protein [Blastocatellia bacterium]